jgi:molecular chaperone DnaJ
MTCLSDPEKRAAFDRFGHAAFAGPGGGARAGGAGGFGGGFHDPFDIFREVFGASGGGGGNAGGIFEQFSAVEVVDARTAKDVSAVLIFAMTSKSASRKRRTAWKKRSKSASSTHVEPATDRERKQGSRAVTCPQCSGRGQVVSSRGFFQVSQTCPRCRGTGQVVERPCRKCAGEGRTEQASRIKLRIPAGIEDGSRLRSVRNGEAGIRGGQPGDLYVVIHLKEHAVFEREGENLYCEVPVSFTVAALGGELEVPTLGGRANVKIPTGTQSGTVFKLRNKGMPVLNSSQVGDLMVRVFVEVPTKLNAEQRAKLQEFAGIMGEENSPLHQSFFEKAKGFFS